jgi:hypothetical protein
MEPRTADTQYSLEIHPWWNNLNDKVAYERMFAEGHPQKMRVAQAMISQDPLTSRNEIRRNMTVNGTPSKTGYPTRELTITQVLNNDLQQSERANTSLWNEFSDSNGETNSTERPGIFW